MNARELEAAFERAFGADPAECRVVARQARDLEASGKPSDDRGTPLTVDVVVENLEDAPDDWSLVKRWNWWLGALEVAHGGYRQFQVTAVPNDDTPDDNGPDDDNPDDNSPDE